MNPYAYYDSLAILSKVGKRVGNTSPSEIHLFAYLACLLWLYKQHPVADWGYGFAGTRTGGPFSFEIDEALNELIGSSHLSEENGLFTITSTGQDELAQLDELNVNKQREAFIDGACSSLLTLPIGMVRNAISSDPDIASASAVQSPRSLLQESAVQDLYDAFAALSKELGVTVTDLMLPATIWLTYLADVAAESLHKGNSLEDNYNKLQHAIQKNHYLTIQAAHGEAGVSAFRNLLEAVRSIYEVVAPETFSEPLIIFTSLDSKPDPIPHDTSLLVTDVSVLRNEAHGRIVVQALNGGQFRVWRDLSVDIPTIAEYAVVYRYHKSTECFYVQDQQADVPDYIEGCASVFVIPTFLDLSSAIQAYALKMARHTTCKILANVWRENDRLFFKSGSEHVMRDSLVQYLRAVLRADVTPEQNVDETKPVDIKVDWDGTNRTAIIEIKWIGDSANEEGAITVRYRDSRANDGAKQLADYLDRKHQHSPGRDIRGYLVVFDARRRGLKVESVQVNQEDGMYYRDREIKYKPAYHDDREDFEAPARVFLEPICR